MGSGNKKDTKTAKGIQGYWGYQVLTASLIASSGSLHGLTAKMRGGFEMTLNLNSKQHTDQQSLILSTDPAESMTSVLKTYKDINQASRLSKARCWNGLVWQGQKHGKKKQISATAKEAVQMKEREKRQGVRPTEGRPLSCLTHVDVLLRQCRGLWGSGGSCFRSWLFRA